MVVGEFDGGEVLDIFDGVVELGREERILERMGVGREIEVLVILFVRMLG